LVIGPAIDDAAGNHDQLKWIGIAMSPTLKMRAQLRGASFVFYQTIAHKKGHYGSFVLNWLNYDEVASLIALVVVGFREQI